ncbi:MAG: CHAT domain-containing protein [Gammaproteobacteria bacterium]
MPGARAEARRVVECLRDAKQVGNVRVEVESRIGPGECDPVEILAQLISVDFDIIHYCGHGDYDPRAPLTAGWVFGKKRLITASDIFRARRVPRLVFANACFSGVLHAGEALASPELSRATATIAQAFFERGVRNFIGAGWPVSDDGASTLAGAFYKGLLQRQSIGTALLNARRAVFDLEGDSTWGAYQHYGDPADRVLLEDGD